MERRSTSAKSSVSLTKSVRESRLEYLMGEKDEVRILKESSKLVTVCFKVAATVLDVMVAIGTLISIKNEIVVQGYKKF